MSLNGLLFEMPNVVLNEFVNSKDIPLSCFELLMNHSISIDNSFSRTNVTSRYLINCDRDSRIVFKLAKSWSANNGTSKTWDSTCKMDNSGSRKIWESPSGEETTSPGPGYNNWVDEPSHKSGEEEIVWDVNSLGKGARNDGCGSASESVLEKPESIPKGGIIISKLWCEEVLSSNEGVVVLKTESKSESAYPPNHGTDAGIHTILKQNVLVILEPDITRLEQRKSRLHEEDNDTGCHDPSCVSPSSVSCLSGSKGFDKFVCSWHFVWHKLDLRF